MRRWGALLVVVVVVVAARFAVRRPVAVELELSYGSSAASLREADLLVTGPDDRVEHEIKLMYPGGAPARDRRSLRLPEGRYSVGARLLFDGRPAATPTRPLEIDRAGTYTLDFSE